MNMSTLVIVNQKACVRKRRETDLLHATCPIHLKDDLFYADLRNAVDVCGTYSQFSVHQMYVERYTTLITSVESNEVQEMGGVKNAAFIIKIHVKVSKHFETNAADG